ncbi:tripartite tricarboxylate transporter permease [Salicibibacter cibarius]|uniref:Tripartite tricarboxylate transporter permease n=1 Tax=Salicibibacter cibarius TaxID=2743000 RepID=A0A7T6Z6P1_9BACI|nr:tripartite tricarboxylate transporter permease [Salicibibacter cibarius]QQK77812.1 tripartite tricarboxylate transporter permease [Salicibibacter cibarius]
MDLNALLDGFDLLMSWTVVLFIILGLILGILLGALPGVSGVLGIALMLPLTYNMAPIDAIMFLTGIFTGSVYSGGVTATLLNIPGSASAVATTLDGYPMTKQGKQNEALGIGLAASAIGSFLGYFIILFAIQPIGQLVLQFGPPEMLLVIMFALSVIGIISGSMLRALIAGVVGLLLGTIGATAFGRPRGNFGITELYEGIEIVPALMGLLAISELFFLISKKSIVDENVSVQRNFKDFLKGMLYTFKDKINAFRSTLIGIGIGLLPAAGSTVAALISYGQGKTHSKRGENYGNGEPSGVVSAEAANSSSEGGSMTTMLTLGIPGGSATAILLAAFMVHGLLPGPYLIRDHMDMTYAVIVGGVFQTFFLVIIGIIFVWYFSKVILVPSRLLIPIIGVLAILGAYSIRGLYIDPLITLIFAIVGLVLRKLEYPVIALLLGLILGSIVDGELARTIVMYEGRFEYLLTRPIFVTMLVLTVIMFCVPLIRKRYGKSISENEN